MKKLKKLEINSRRIIKNEELTLLRGGYDDCWFCVIFDGFCYYPLGCTVGESCDAVRQALSDLYNPSGYQVGCTGTGCTVQV